MISARDGRRYRELIELAGSRGIEESICQGDFSRALDNIGRILRESLDVNCLGEAPRRAIPIWTETLGRRASLSRRLARTSSARTSRSRWRSRARMARTSIRWPAWRRAESRCGVRDRLRRRGLSARCVLPLRAWVVAERGVALSCRVPAFHRDRATVARSMGAGRFCGGVRRGAVRGGFLLCFFAGRRT
jgi:hypothetical protein